jgi:Zn-finger nucleic acid-binding protein
MGTGQLCCPACSGNLLTGQVEGFRQYECESCGGVVVGIAVLRQLCGPVGQHIWTAEPAPGENTDVGRCPFCPSQMQPKSVPVGKAAICKACEVVWLDKAAVSSLPVTAAPPPGQPTLETQALRCEQCGAPVVHTWDEQCQYCGAALHPPTKVVVLENGLAEDGQPQYGQSQYSQSQYGQSLTRRRGTSRLAHALAMLMSPVD